MANIPEELKYTKTHEWVRVEEGLVTIGISDFAQKELSDIVYVEITTLGQSVAEGESIGTIEAVKAVADLYAPISGKVVEANEFLADQPETVNKDPYGNGWIAKLVPAKPDELEELLDAAAYAELARRSEHH